MPQCRVSRDDIEALAKLAQDENIELTIVGPEAPLVAGIVDRFKSLGLPCFGPSAKAAQLEGSKAFTKDFLARHNIPTAAYQNFSELEPALDVHSRTRRTDCHQGGRPCRRQRCHRCDDARRGGSRGDRHAGRQQVWRCRRAHRCRGISRRRRSQLYRYYRWRNMLPMATSQDHKARDEGDVGPNTGGMGAYSPAPVVTPEIEQRIMDEVIRPTLRACSPTARLRRFPVCRPDDHGRWHAQGD